MRSDRGVDTGSTRSGFTVLELLAVSAIASLLMGLLLPAIHSARETARRMQCTNNLRQLGIALHDYHSINRSLPAGWRIESSQQTAFGWASAILPHLEERNLTAQIDFQSRVDSAANAAARSVSPAVFLCPSDVHDQTFAMFAESGEHESNGTNSTAVLVRLPSANYVGVFGTSDPDGVPVAAGEGAFLVNRPLRFADISRGLSNTIFVGERTARKLPSTWFGIVLDGEDAVGRIVGNADKGPNRDDADECEFDSRHPGCVNFLWGDGHVKSISDSIDSATYRRLATRF